MDQKIIKQAIKLMNENDLGEFSYSKKDSFSFTLKKNKEILNSENTTKIEPNVTKKIDGEKKFFSPLVGIFYQSPSPEDQSFVKVGDKVTVGQVLCIIESMKVMNEIESDFEGVITEILVSDAESVEYNQAILKYK